jgi:hypothetical protein
MRTTLCYCDRCEQPEQEGRIRLMHTIGTMAALPIDLRSGKATLDLCAGCADELVK